MKNKKIIYGILICLLLTVGIGGFAIYHNINQSPLRLHVIANSDSPYDQEVKLFVRDQILDLLAQNMNDAKTKESAIAALLASLPEIEKRCNEVLSELAPYGAEARLEVAQFPTKRYGEMVLPAGKYDALRVVLGEGRGKNWWCVLFPPLCLVDLAKEVEVTALPVTEADTRVSAPVGGSAVDEKMDEKMGEGDQKSLDVIDSQVKVKMKWSFFNK
ncbi:MAG: stage II sporulation protein R [Bacillota bacterium]|jgi:stage II sporulation protein R